MADEIAAKTSEVTQKFEVQKIYLVDASFESPMAPQVFADDLKMNTNVDLNSSNRQLSEESYEVLLHVTVTVKNDEKIVYLAEVKQAAVFAITGYEPAQLGQLLGSYAPNIIYPFTREVVSDLVIRGGFKQMLLAPINFDALYAQHLKSQAEAAEQSDDAIKH